ncbi:uncharacterized protein [Elaeis guineensis]|uniref:uncharacterized protein n=1 Tax=Elaeis guineensis var. tenera TaxID=51953 RepID=UPI003C6DAEC9
MRHELKRKFLPDHYCQDIFIKFHNLRPKSLTVEEYTMAFEEFFMKCDVHEPEEQMIACYLDGLNWDISDTVQLQPYYNLSDVIQLAIKVEKQQARKRTMKQKKPATNRWNQGSKAAVPKANPVFPKASSSKATNNKDAKETNATRTDDSSRKYFKCQGFGHITADCPNRRIIILVKEESNEEGNDDEAKYDNNNEEEVPADDGESLMIRRALNAAMMTEDESWPRHNIFHTRCTTKGKVCKVIIDGGSYENIIANYMVEKLKLPTKAHPQPYRLQWL